MVLTPHTLGLAVTVLENVTAKPSVLSTHLLERSKHGNGVRYRLPCVATGLLPVAYPHTPLTITGK